MSYLKSKEQIAKFKTWLEAHGVDMRSPTNEFELVRFHCGKGTGVLYKKKNGQQSTSGPLMDDAIKSFKTNNSWSAGGKKTKRKASMKNQLIARDGLRCFYCGDNFKQEHLTQEHILSVLHGGPNTLINMALACEPCNTEAGHKSIVKKVALRDKKHADREMFSLPMTLDIDLDEQNKAVNY